MPILIKSVIALVAGGVLGSAAMGGLIVSQTQAPEKNPASQELFSYGDR